MSIRMAATLSCSVFIGNPSAGVSDVAKFIDTQAARNRQRLWTSNSLGPAILLEDLQQLADECGAVNWDGYGATPIPRERIDLAERLLLSLPLGMTRPTIGADPDGHVTFEWCASPRRTLTVSVDSDDRMHYAALFGPRTQYGSEVFFGQFPETILNLVYRVLRA